MSGSDRELDTLESTGSATMTTATTVSVGVTPPTTPTASLVTSRASPLGRCGSIRGFCRWHWLCGSRSSSAAPMNCIDEAKELIDLRIKMADIQDLISRQFVVLQTRSQQILSIAALSLTITGFSGPKIAASNAVSRISLAVGLTLTLLSLTLTMLSSFQIRWVTQFSGVETDPHNYLAEVLEYRNWKTWMFNVEMAALVTGLGFYVVAIVVYLFVGDPQV
ncbi:hypothetical protein Pelo_308 [Pelomyxa schiedti]|nr:hypothetical protein Pelo_308 [Pelomyxa schiedti]